MSVCPISNRWVMWGCLPVFIVCCVVTVAWTAPVERPNIVLIYTDDQAPGMTGFEGNTEIKTPHLDRLAGESVFFTRCYVPTPQCAPSRACVLTGQYPHSNGVVTNGSADRPMQLRVDADTFSQRLKKAGYACGIVGKWHLSYETSNKPGYGLTDYIAADGHPWQWNDCDVWVQGEKAKADKFLTDWHGDRAIEFIEQYQKQPFFLWLCFRSPHAPLVYPPGTESLYPPGTLKLPDTLTANQKDWPPRLWTSDPVNGGKRQTADTLRQARSKYYSMITRIDDNVGRLLGRIDDLGLRDHTVVVFASDNGWCLGDHGLFAKGPMFFEELVRGPLLIRYPGVSEPGSRIDRVVSLVDLAPTFCEVAGVNVPITMQGRSLMPAIKDSDTADHMNERFLEYDSQKGKSFPARGIVTQRYKFIDYLQDRDMLYDLERDPKEMVNVVDEPQYSGIVKSLQARLEAWRTRTKDETQKPTSRR